MQLELRQRLPFVTITVTHRGASIDIPEVLVDTGSARSAIDADFAGEIGVVAATGEQLKRMDGIGGSEDVFTHRVDRVSVGDRTVENVVVQVGNLGYGYGINGILGMDILRMTSAIIDVGEPELRFAA